MNDCNLQKEGRKVNYTICKTLSEESVFSEVLNLVQRNAKLTFGFDSETNSLTMNITDCDNPEINFDMQGSVDLFKVESDKFFRIAVSMTADEFLKKRRNA